MENNDEKDPREAEGAPSETPKNLDEEWAETLQINYQTPPPMPEQPQQPSIPQNPYYGQPNPHFGIQPGASAPRPRPQEREPMPPTYLVMSVIITILCCTIPGIVAIVYSSQVSSRYYVDDIEGARRASRNAEIWIIVSFVLGVLSATLYLPLTFL